MSGFAISHATKTRGDFCEWRIEDPRRGEEEREQGRSIVGGCKRRARLRRGAFHCDDKFWNLQALSEHRHAGLTTPVVARAFVQNIFQRHPNCSGATRRFSFLSRRGVSNRLLNKQPTLIRLQFHSREERGLQYV